MGQLVLSSFEIAKLIGSANTKTWAQVHTFTPEDGEKRERYGSLFAVFSLKSREQEEQGLVEIAAFGREIITRFHELYFSPPPQLACYERLEQAFVTIQKEYAQQVALSGTAAVVLAAAGKMAFYVTRLGEAQAFLWRNSELTQLLGDGPVTRPESLSGWLEPEDVFLLGTDRLFEVVPQGSLKAALQQTTLEQTSQVLTPMIHGHEDNALVALVLGRAQEREQGTQQKPLVEPGQETPPEETGRTVLISSRFGRIKAGLSAFWRQLVEPRLKGGWLTLRTRALSHRNIAVRDGGPIRRSRKTAISVALIFLILLGVSVGIGLRRKQTVRLDHQDSEAFATVQYSLEQAQQLAELNPGRAKSLLLEAQATLQTYQAEHPGEEAEVAPYTDQITEWLARVSREYRFDQAETFFDLSLIKEDFKAKRWGATDKEVVILGQDVVATLNLDKKQSAVIAGGQEVTGAVLVGSVSPWGLVATEDALLAIDKSKQRVIDDQALDDIHPTDLVGYAGNAYVLDATQNQIWRFAGLADGLAKAQAYMKGEPKLEGAVALAIDGSIWILFGDGGVVKYTRGVQDAFAVSGLDVAYGEPIRLFTDENQENLYILDRKNTRVVVIAKTGEYQAQYVWPGIAGVVDVLVSEELGKIFLLTESRIYSLEIKK